MIHTARDGSYKGGRSYLMIDDRASGGKLLEYITDVCSHCNIIVVLNTERTRPRARCVRCSRYVCDSCAAFLPECNYIEEMIDLALANPGKGPFLARGLHGEVLYDTSLRDAKRLH